MYYVFRERTNDHQDIYKSVVQNAKEKVLRKSARDISKVAIDNAQIRILRETTCETALVNATAMENAQKSISKETTRDIDVAHVKESSVSKENATDEKEFKASLHRKATLSSKNMKSGKESKASTSRGTFIAPSSEINSMAIKKHTRASISQKRKIISPPPMLPFNCTQAITKIKKTFPTFEPGLAKTGMPIIHTCI